MWPPTRSAGFRMSDGCRGQIPIFYNFGERIARSITFNIAFWLDGDISFGQGLVNVGVDTVNAFIQLGIDQWNFWLWPLPPLPPIFPVIAIFGDGRSHHDRGRDRGRDGDRECNAPDEESSRRRTAKLWVT